MPADRQRVRSGSAFEAQIAYSRAVVAGDWVFVSGCTGYDYATGVLASGVAAQAEQALRNVAAALAAVQPGRGDGDGDGDGDSGGGSVDNDDHHHHHHHDYAPVTMADVVRVRYMLPDRALFPQTWPVLQRWFGGDGGARPAATMLQAGLMEEAMLFEVEVTARRRRRQRQQARDRPELL